MELTENKTIEHEVADILNVDFSQVQIAKPRDGEPREVRVETRPEESIKITAEMHNDLSAALSGGVLISIMHPQRDDMRVQEKNGLALAA